MKKIATAISVLSMAFLVSCGGGKPEDVAIDFGKALLDGDVQAAQAASTEETAKLMPLIIGLASSQMGKMSDEEKKEALAELDTMECDVEGDIAKCGPKGKSKKFELKKVDGDWKVHIDKKGKQ